MIAGAKLRTYQLGDLVAASWFTGRPRASTPGSLEWAECKRRSAGVRPGRRPYDFIVR
jgi:hypothetical protein